MKLPVFNPESAFGAACPWRKDGSPVSGEDCGSASELSFPEKPPATEETLSSSCLLELQIHGNSVEAPFQGLVWQSGCLSEESLPPGGRSCQLRPLPPDFIASPPLFGATRIRWTSTAVRPLARELYPSRGCGTAARRDAADCPIHCCPFHGAASGLVLLEGGPLWSRQGFRYAGLSEEPGDPAGGEIPESGTAASVAAGLMAARVFRCIRPLPGR